MYVTKYLILTAVKMNRLLEINLAEILHRICFSIHVGESGVVTDNLLSPFIPHVQCITWGSHFQVLTCARSCLYCHASVFTTFSHTWAIDSSLLQLTVAFSSLVSEFFILQYKIEFLRCFNRASFHFRWRLKHITSLSESFPPQHLSYPMMSFWIDLDPFCHKLLIILSYLPKAFCSSKLIPLFPQTLIHCF